MRFCELNLSCDAVPAKSRPDDLSSQAAEDLWFVRSGRMLPPAITVDTAACESREAKQNA
jgi:hypothetical protein